MRPGAHVLHAVKASAGRAGVSLKDTCAPRAAVGGPRRGRGRRIRSGTHLGVGRGRDRWRFDGQVSLADQLDLRAGLEGQPRWRLISSKKGPVTVFEFKQKT